MVFGVQAQSKKIVMIEHFTQASCPPCASINPQILPIVQANEDKVAIIHHQTSWPGRDPMNDQNPGDVQRRVTYYGVRGVPNSVINGQQGPGSPLTYITQSIIDREYNKTPSMELDLQVDANTAFDGLDIELNITATQDLSGSYVAYVTVVEQEIEFDRAPGTNGERVFHNVLKKMLPNSGGTDLPSTWTNGMSENIKLNYTFENFYDWKQAGVVAFVQNVQTKEILQAHHWRADFEPTTGDDVLIQAAFASGRAGEDYVCGVSTEPVITVMNAGNTDLSAFDVEYSINGGAPQSYTWSGSSIGTFESIDVTLPSIGFTRDFVNELNVEVNNPNGQEDQEPTNGSLLSDFLPSDISSTDSEFRIRGRVRPSDISFKITDDAGAIVLESNGLPSRDEQSYNLSLDPNTCYEIEVINDYSGLNGDFQIYDASGNRVFKVNVLKEGTYYRQFGTFPPVSSKDFAAVTEWSIAPNPGVSDFVITAQIAEKIDAQIEVVDLLGTVHRSVNNTWNDGLQTQSVDMSNLPRGMYLVSIKSGDKITTKRWLKN